jgi:NAD(P)-dependent dehydrogenase (short-subunit alcohol dehydrogenase family)
MTKVVLVTGASRGIGRATALLLARQGYAVGVNYLKDEAAAAQVVAEIEAMGGRALALRADVADENQVVAMFNALDVGLGPISALVNNAGILFQQSGIEQLTAERINKVLNTNVTGYFLCCRETVKRMAQRHGGQGGAIVNVSSAAARLGAPGEYIDYAAFQRGGRHAYHRAGAGGGGAGHPRKCRAARADLYRNACQRRRAGAR